MFNRKTSKRAIFKVTNFLRAHLTGEMIQSLPVPDLLFEQSRKKEKRWLKRMKRDRKKVNLIVSTVQLIARQAYSISTGTR
jgi:hypothetical protein